jgi:dCMP deaminase
MTRPTKTSIYIEIARAWAKRSTCSSKVAVGAVLVSSDGRVIASGYNGSPRGEPHCDDVGCLTDTDGHCLRAIHAEENALIQCAIHGISSVGTMLISTHQPCDRCARRLAQAGVIIAYYLEPYGKTHNYEGLPMRRITYD